MNKHYLYILEKNTYYCHRVILLHTYETAVNQKEVLRPSYVENIQNCSERLSFKLNKEIMSQMPYLPKLYNYCCESRE